MNDQPHTRVAPQPAHLLPAVSEGFDVLVFADMTRAGDVGLRIAQEIRTFDRLGHRVGLVHLPGSPPSGRILPDIQCTVRDGVAEVVEPGRKASAKLAVVHAPSLISQLPQYLDQLSADHALLVFDRAPSVADFGRWSGFLSGTISVAPTNRWVRAAVRQLGLAIRLEEEDWRPIAPVEPDLRPRAFRGPPIVGSVCTGSAGQWPATLGEAAKVLPGDGSLDVRLLGSLPKEFGNDPGRPATWRLFDSDDLTVQRFVQMLDVFAYFPGPAVSELPDAAIAAAMGQGKIILLPPHLRPHFGPGAIYGEPDQAVAAIKELAGNADALGEAQARARYHAPFQFSAEQFSSRIEALVGKPRRARRGPVKPVRPPKPRVLFIPSNGVGLGHVTRLLAIARRADDKIEPIFATMAQAAAIIESFGYSAEYIPSYSDTGAALGDWDQWLRVQLEWLIDHYQADMVVFDGNNLTPGLVRSVLSRGSCKLAWIRRGMVGPVASPFVDNASFCDLVIEPGELATRHDVGPTAERRGETLLVPPVRLLDEADLLSRAEAMAALGLDDSRPAVLLHLGAGANRSVPELIDAVIAQLLRFPQIQIVVAEWANGSMDLPRWPNVKFLRGFPFGRFFNAFDFSIGAAGYNTFHEAIAFALPTVFIADTHPSMDDQAGRAQFAQNAGAGFDLPAEQLFHLPAVCEVLLNDMARRQIREGCRRLGSANGAVEAGNALCQLLVPR